MLAVSLMEERQQLIAPRVFVERAKNLADHLFK
mgnify:CR=1 FL=1